MSGRPKLSTVAALLFCSGFCALIYQTVWLREFRLIFGASTAASAAVLGIFMGGLGLGSAMLGRRAESAPKPLLFYGNLELMIAVFAALTPAIVQAVRWIYSATGGTMVLGPGLGTVVRLLMAAVVLIGPTFLMGGTLPAAARSIASDTDPGRRRLALLYGTNTLGAVIGAALSTFWLIEFMGNRAALWLATGLNVLVALLARGIAHRSESFADDSCESLAVEEVAPEPDSSASVPMVVVSSALVGFAFMLMELVWYRMLAPILGGSTFTFGLILVLALLGIGLGGIAYTLLRSNRVATLDGFALTCAIEAFLMIVPYALGDRLAYLALMLRPLGSLGFATQVFGWFIVAGIVLLPASIVAGYQFPMLISLLGRGRAGVAKHTGLAYAANTVGAIAGSLAGGFGLIPLLTAPGVWRLVVGILATLAIAAALHKGRRFGLRLAPIGVAAFAIILVFSAGPTAAWRHSGIGAGRAKVSDPNINSLKFWADANRRGVVWEAEGLESSVALQAQSALSFVVNGKVDGNSRLDAGTQSMGGLLPALLHPAPRKAMIIGLGTGSTAGWLGKLPEMEKVDVVEIEPAILEVARRCAPVNNDVMSNPKVHTFLGDAREVLITTPEKYDIIFSEPSNPYRAGIASLFTSDFYEAAQHRLAPGGVFAQWLQCYEIDQDTVRTVLATVGKTFPYLQVWRTQINDFILIGTKEPITIDADGLRQKIGEPTFKQALFNAWRVDSLEGVLSHFVANEDLVRRVIASEPDLATDDRNPLEYGFARGLGRDSKADVALEIVAYSQKHHLDRPQRSTGSVNWEVVASLGPSADAVENAPTFEALEETADRSARRALFFHYLQRDYASVVEVTRKAKLAPISPIELEAMAEAAVFTDDPSAGELIEKLEAIYPPEARALRAGQAAIRKDWKAAAEGYASVFRDWQKDPWVRPAMLRTFLTNALDVARASGKPEIARLLFDTLGTPFAVELQRESRMTVRFELAKITEANPANPQSLEAMREFGAHPEWTGPFLEQRLAIYRQLGDPNEDRAAEDLISFRSHESTAFEKALRPVPAAAAAPPATAANQSFVRDDAAKPN